MSDNPVLILIVIVGALIGLAISEYVDRYRYPSTKRKDFLMLDVDCIKYYSGDELKSVDVVNHPAHYKTTNGLETIDVIDAFTEGLTGTEAVCTGNILKYVCRWKKKNGMEDLRKAQWYLNHLISTLEGAESE